MNIISTLQIQTIKKKISSPIDFHSRLKHLAFTTKVYLFHII